VEITIHSPVAYSDQPLTKLIESASSDRDLLNLANEDLSKVIVAQKGNVPNEQIEKQNRLLHSRIQIQQQNKTNNIMNTTNLSKRNSIISNHTRKL
jgi:hypothetical protein